MFLLGILLGCAEPEVIRETAYITETVTETETITEEICATIEGRQPCDFYVFDEDGAEVNFHSLIGIPVILDLSTMWCGPCNAAAVEVQNTQDRYPDLVYLTILIENSQGIDPTHEDLQDWEAYHGITTAPTWGGSREVISDDPTESDEFYLRSWPTFYFLDEELKIVGYQQGFNQTIIDEWAEDLTKSE